IEQISKILIPIPNRDVDDETRSLRHDDRRGKTTGDEGRTDAGREHSVPVAQRLLLEWSSEFPIVVLLITAPCVVDKQIESSLLTLHARKQLFDIGVNCMITTHSETAAAARRNHFGGFFNRAWQIFSSRFAPDAAPRHVDGRAHVAQCESDAAARAAAG